MRYDYQIIYYQSFSNETILVRKGGERETYNGKPKKLFNDWCLKNGSSLKGRIESFRYLLNISQKPCILVSEKEPIIFLPTMSMDALDCQFIQFDCIASIHQNHNGSCEVVTKDGSKLLFNVDYRVLKMQYKRSELFLKKLKLIDRKFLVFEID